MTIPNTKTGFTIVELLIVIVVIAILAAITIVAFNGIQERARVSSVSSALSQANKKIAVFQIDNPDQYPADLASVGITNTSGVSYQYSVNNGATPANYCITATNGSTSYKISSTNTAATSGGCPGHGQGGAAPISNLATNPSLETTTASWGYYVAGGAATSSRQTTGGYRGSGFYRLSWTTTTTAVSGGLYPFSMGTGNMNPGATYTASVWVRSSKDQTMRPQLTFRDSSNVTVGTTLNGPTVSVTANIWTRLSISGVAPAGTNSALMTAYAHTGGSFWQPGDTLDGDAAMLTEGNTLITYADGTSTDWAWNGTPHTSSSTGPAL